MCAFYRDGLGLLERVRHFRPDGTLRSVWLAVGETSFLALERADPNEKHADRSHFVFAFRIDREERIRAVEALRRLGIGLERETRWTIFFRDPEGNRLALSHHPSDPL